MKLTLKNFGPIHEMSLDLEKSMTLIVGQNNIGKSYAISLIYALIKSLNSIINRDYYFHYKSDSLARYTRVTSHSLMILDKIYEKFESESINSFNTTEDINSLLKDHLDRKITPQLQQALYSTFGDIKNLQNRMTNDLLEIILIVDDIEVIWQILNKDLVLKSITFPKHKYVIKRIKQNRKVKDDGNETTIYFSNDNKELLTTNILNLIEIQVYEFLKSACGGICDLHYLPASRSGLYQALSAFGQIIAELSKNRMFLKNKIELPSIAEPLTDYFLTLSTIATNLRETENSKNYYEIASYIEKEILRGEVEFEMKAKKLVFKPHGISLTLDLSSTSSMVSEISPIASYLKYILPAIDANRRGSSDNNDTYQLIILEEPEAHLHPEVQLLLMQALSKLVATTKTKIILTSHSNYIFNKCSNLIINKDIDSNNFSSILFEKSEHGSISKNMKISEFGIQDENFLDTAEKLYAERLALINNMNEN